MPNQAEVLTLGEARYLKCLSLSSRRPFLRGFSPHKRGRVRFSGLGGRPCGSGTLSDFTVPSAFYISLEPAPLSSSLKHDMHRVFGWPIFCDLEAEFP